MHHFEPHRNRKSGQLKKRFHLNNLGTASWNKMVSDSEQKLAVTLYNLCGVNRDENSVVFRPILFVD